MIKTILTYLGLYRAPTPTQPSARRMHLATLRGKDRATYYWLNGR